MILFLLALLLSSPLTLAAPSASDLAMLAKPPPFTGEGNPAHFIFQLLQFFVAAEIFDQKQQLALLSNFLAGAALDWFIGAHKSISTFSQFGHELSEVFPYSTPPPTDAAPASYQPAAPAPSFATPTTSQPSTSAPATAPPATSTQALHPSLIPQPLPYAGLACTNYQDVRHFLFNLDGYFHLTSVPKDTVCCYLLCQFLTGPALTWAMSVSHAITSYTQFTDGLKAQFSAVNADEASRTKLEMCKQTNSVATYVDQFRSICVAITNLCPIEKLRRFLAGLKPDVRLQTALANPNSFDRAAEIALTYERTVNLHSSTSSLSHRPNTTTVPAPATHHRLNAVTSSPATSRTPLTPALRAELMDNGSCLYCRQPGHVLANCPTRPPRPAKHVPGKGQPQ